jgi:hypothetical protein
MDREKMFSKNITMEDVANVLRHAAADSVKMTYTDHNASRMVFRIRLDSTPEDQLSAVDALVAVKALQTRLLTQTLVRGLPGLRAVSFRKVGDELFERNPDHDGKYEPIEQFVLDTFGTNFLDVLIHPDVDGTRLISNHIHDIYENLGIEAARQILFREIFVGGLREFLGAKAGLLAVTPLAKWKTTAQMVAIAVLFLGTGLEHLEGIARQGMTPDQYAEAVTAGLADPIRSCGARGCSSLATMVGLVLIWIAAALTFVTGWDYFRKSLPFLRDER